MTKHIALLLLLGAAAWAQSVGVPISVQPSAATQNCCTGIDLTLVITQQGGGDFLNPPASVLFQPPNYPSPILLKISYTSSTIRAALPGVYLTQAGTGTLTVSWSGGDLPTSSSVPYVINPEPTGVSPTFVAVAIGQAFSRQLSIVGGGTPPFSWATLPGWGGIPGVTLGNTGVLSGTISTALSTTVPLMVVDSSGYLIVDQTISVQALNGPVITNVSPNPVIANCCDGDATLDVYGSGLDIPNLSKEVRYGTGSTTLGSLEVWGTATHLQVLFPSTVPVGAYWIEVETVATSPRYTVYVADPLQLSTTSLPPGTVGTPYSATLSATGGLTPYAWSVPAGSLPPGLSLDSASGAISGTPTQTGTFSIPVTVTDASKQNASRDLTITVTTPLTIQTADAGHTVINTPYTVNLQAAGGLPPYTWSITEGALPSGMTLDGTAGVISGTASIGGAYTFIVQVGDATRATTTRTLALVVLSEPVALTFNVPDPAPGGQGNVTIGLGGTDALRVDGTVALTFTPDDGLPDDPAVQFASGGRSAVFSNQQADLASIPMQMGTVAGTITLQATVSADGVDVTPSPAPVRTIRIAPAPPTIISAAVARTNTGLEVTITGFATSRNVTSATFRFAVATGESLQSPETTVQLNQAFTTWYNDPGSDQFGSQFLYTQPFTIEGNAQALTGVTVTLTNAQGTSAPVNAAF